MDFSPAIDAVFDAFGVAAVYTPPTPPGGAAVACTAILRMADPTENFGQAGAIVSELVAEIRASELPAPLERGTLVVGGVTYQVRSPRRAVDRLVWVMGLRETP